MSRLTTIICYILVKITQNIHIKIHFPNLRHIAGLLTHQLYSIWRHKANHTFLCFCISFLLRLLCMSWLLQCKRSLHLLLSSQNVFSRFPFFILTRPFYKRNGIFPVWWTVPNSILNVVFLGTFNFPNRKAPRNEMQGVHNMLQ